MILSDTHADDVACLPKDIVPWRETFWQERVLQLLPNELHACPFKGSPYVTNFMGTTRHRLQASLRILIRISEQSMHAPREAMHQ